MVDRGVGSDSNRLAGTGDTMLVGGDDDSEVRRPLLHAEPQQYSSFDPVEFDVSPTALGTRSPSNDGDGSPIQSQRYQRNTRDGDDDGFIYDTTSIYDSDDDNSSRGSSRGGGRRSNVLSLLAMLCVFLTCGFWQPTFHKQQTQPQPRSTNGKRSFRDTLRAIRDAFLMLFTTKTMKSTLCYIVCVLIGITPWFNARFESNGYLFVTAVLYFHPSRTIGAMLEAMIICYIGLAFGVLIANACLQIAYFYHTAEGEDSKHIASICAFLALAFVTFILAFIRARFGSKRASINTGCTMTHILTFLTITQIPNERSLNTLQIRIYRIAGALLAGSFVSFLGCILIQPTTSARGLQDDIRENIKNMETFLEAAEETILGDANSKKNSNQPTPFEAWIRSTTPLAANPESSSAKNNGDDGNGNGTVAGTDSNGTNGVVQTNLSPNYTGTINRGGKNNRGRDEHISTSNHNVEEDNDLLSSSQFDPISPRVIDGHTNQQSIPTTRNTGEVSVAIPSDILMNSGLGLSEGVNVDNILSSQTRTPSSITAVFAAARAAAILAASLPRKNALMESQSKPRVALHARPLMQPGAYQIPSERRHSYSAIDDEAKENRSGNFLGKDNVTFSYGNDVSEGFSGMNVEGERNTTLINFLDSENERSSDSNNKVDGKKNDNQSSVPAVANSTNIEKEPLPRATSQSELGRSLSQVRKQLKLNADLNSSTSQVSDTEGSGAKTDNVSHLTPQKESLSIVSKSRGVDSTLNAASSSTPRSTIPILTAITPLDEVTVGTGSLLTPVQTRYSSKSKRVLVNGIYVTIPDGYEIRRMRFHKDVQELLRKHSKNLLHLEVSRYEVSFEVFSSVYLHRKVYGRIFHCIERLTQHIGGLKSSLLHIEKEFESTSESNKFHTYIFIDRLSDPMRRLLTTCIRSLDVLKDIIITPQSDKNTHLQLEAPLRTLAESMILVLHEFDSDQRRIPLELFKYVTNEILLIFVFIFELEELAKEIVTLTEQVLILVRSINEMHRIGRLRFAWNTIVRSKTEVEDEKHPIWLELSRKYFTASKNMQSKLLRPATLQQQIQQQQQGQNSQQVVQDQEEQQQDDSYLGANDRATRIHMLANDLGYSPGTGFEDMMTRAFNGGGRGAIDVTQTAYPHMSSNLARIRETARIRQMQLRSLSIPTGDVEAILEQQEKEKGSTLVDQFNFNAWNALMNLRKFEFRFAFKTAVSICFLCLPAFIPSTQEFYYEYKLNWSMASFIVVMTPNVGGTNKAGFLRLLGTVGGALAAIVTGELSNEENVFILLLCSLLVAIPSFWGRFHTKYDKIGHIFLLTYTIAALNGFNGNEDPTTGRPRTIREIALRRGVAVFIGVITGMIVSWYVWPFTARKALRVGLSNVLFDIGLLYGKLTSVLGSAKLDTSHGMSLKKFFDSELTLRLALAECNSLLELTDHEPRMKGRFPKEVYKDILEACGNVLDKLISMRVAISKSGFNAVRQDFFAPLQPLRKPLISSTMLYLYVLSTVLVVRYPVPPLPETRKHRQHLLAEVRKLPVLQPENVKTQNDVTYIYYYAYVVGMEDIMDDLDVIGDCLQELFGKMSEQSQVLFDHDSLESMA